jgi:hypothetical protein
VRFAGPAFARIRIEVEDGTGRLRRNVASGEWDFLAQIKGNKAIREMTVMIDPSSPWCKS